MAKGYNKARNLHKCRGNSSFTVKVSSTIRMTMRIKTQNAASKEVKNYQVFFLESKVLSMIMVREIAKQTGIKTE